jgi:hypothetical protein
MPAMGFNPFRTQQKTAVDVLLVVGTLLIVVVLLLWATLSG